MGLGRVNNVRRWRAISSAVLLALSFLSLSAAYAQGPRPVGGADGSVLSRAQGGIDASDWDFATDGPLPLADGWTVYRGALIDPERFAGGGCALSDAGLRPEPATMPDMWGPALTLDPATGHGVATYCLELETGPQEKFVGFQLGIIRSIAAVHVLYKDDLHSPAHASLLYRSGDVSSRSHEHVYNPATPVISLPHEAEHITLIIQVANYVHKQGGMIYVPVVDLSERLEANYRRNSALPTALFLVLSVISIATLFAGRFHEDKLRFNVFAFLTMASALRVFFVSDIIWDYFPTITAARKYDFEYMSLFLVLSAYYAFIHMLFRREQLTWFDKAVYSMSAAMAFFAVVVAPLLPAGTITLTREPIQFFWLLIACVVAFTLVKSILSDPRQKKDAVLVFLAAASMSLYEVLIALGVIEASMEWSQVLVLFVTLLHVRAFALNLRLVEEERDELNRHLVAANESLEAQTAELSEALLRAEESARSKSSFLAAMSHELRTPLNAIIGFSEMIHKQVFGPVENENYLEYATDINRSGQQLLGTINDILDLSRIESGYDAMFDEELDLETLVSSIVHLASAQEKAGDIKMRLQCPDDLPLFRGDGRKVKQLLHNLLSNAVKFNVADGWVEVSLFLQDGCFVLQVADSGIGMSNADIEKALSHFQQIDGDLGRRYEGLGLGLSLVQALAEQHGASLQITSVINDGTTVSVVFPANRTIVPAANAAEMRVQ